MAANGIMRKKPHMWLLAHLDKLLSCDDIVHVQVKLAEQVANGHETSCNTL